jgi:hypothetical protein
LSGHKSCVSKFDRMQPTTIYPCMKEKKLSDKKKKEIINFAKAFYRKYGKMMSKLANE